MILPLLLSGVNKLLTLRYMNIFPGPSTECCSAAVFRLNTHVIVEPAAAYLQPAAAPLISVICCTQPVLQHCTGPVKLNCGACSTAALQHQSGIQSLNCIVGWGCSHSHCRGVPDSQT